MLHRIQLSRLYIPVRSRLSLLTHLHYQRRYSVFLSAIVITLSCYKLVAFYQLTAFLLGVVYAKSTHSFRFNWRTVPV